MVFEVKVGEHGQVVIPRSIREYFGIRPDAVVSFYIRRGTIIVTPMKATHILEEPDEKGVLADPPEPPGIGYSTDKYFDILRGK